MRRLAVGLLLVLGTACAQPGRPPGGEVDRSPPRVIAVTPAAFDTLRVLSRPVRIRFDERLSERLEGVTDLGRAVQVSPETGRVRVRQRRRAIEVSVAGGWREGLVYRVVVQPVLRDLFQNLRTEPIDLVFSTGAPFEEGAVAGFVRDRLTGEAVVNARVEAVPPDTALRYVAVTDTAGFYAFRYLPGAAYRVRGWLDQNRDGAIDFFEPRDSAAVAIEAGDTAVLELSLLPADTTAANLTRVEALDTLTVRLLFDDHFAPGPVDGTGRVLRLADSAVVATGELLHGTRLDSLQAARGEESVPDTVAAAGDDPDAERDPPPVLRPPEVDAAARPGAGRAAGRQRAGAAPLPSRELILVLTEPLAADSAYYVAVEGVTNINGVPGGGGDSRFRTPAPPPPDTVPPDTTAGGRGEGGR